jgi:phytoene dehydrogenase-like protein
MPTPMPAGFTGFGPTSPWGSLLHAYEESTLGGDDLNRHGVYRRLMNVAPVVEFADGDDFTTVRAPEYDAFLKVAKDQTEQLTKFCARLRKQEQGGSPSLRLRRLDGLLDFWQNTVPAARKKKFAAATAAGGSLEELDTDWGDLMKDDPGAGGAV